MYSTKNIVENAVNSKDLTTLVTEAKAAGMVETQAGPGPLAVSAQTNAAFNKLPAGAVDTLLEPENKDQLVKVLTYHVVACRVSSHDLIKMIKRERTRPRQNGARRHVKGQSERRNRSPHRCIGWTVDGHRRVSSERLDSSDRFRFAP